MKITKIYQKNRIKQIALPGIIIILGFLIFCQPVSAQNSLAQLDRLENMLEQNRYSGFQTRMVLQAIEELFSFDVNEQEVFKILAGSIDERFDAYNIKKILEVLIDSGNNGISEMPLINKVKEGLAKNVEERLIVDALLREAENYKSAKNILKANTRERASSEREEQEMINVLADSLNNGVPTDALSEVLSKSLSEGKDSEEITDISVELGNLSLRAYELGFSEEEVLGVFKKAMQSRIEVDSLCEDIQDILVGAAAAKMKIASDQGSGGSSQTGSISGTTVGGSIDGSISDTESTPSDSGTSSPTAADDKPDTNDKPDNDSSSPPEN